jgi:hypothetical protein
MAPVALVLGLVVVACSTSTSSTPPVAVCAICVVCADGGTGGKSGAPAFAAELEPLIAQNRRTTPYRALWC